MCPCSSGFLMSLKSEREPSVQSCSAPPRTHKRLCRKTWPLFCYVSQTCVERWCRSSSRRGPGDCRPLRASVVESVTCSAGIGPIAGGREKGALWGLSGRIDETYFQ
jgi:hypothetical protein